MGIEKCQDCLNELKYMDEFCVYTTFGKLVGSIYYCPICQKQIIIQEYIKL